MRFYFCNWVPDTVSGDGIGIMPAVLRVKPAAGFKMIDMRQYQEISDGYAVVWSNTTAQEHAALLADPDMEYLPFELSDGSAAPYATVLSQLPLANVQAIQASFEAKGIPTDGITLTWTVGQVLQQLRRRCMVKLILHYQDFDDLTALISSIPPLKLKALKARLQNVGFNLAGITASMTFRAALLNLYGQTAIIDGLIAQRPQLAV